MENEHEYDDSITQYFQTVFAIIKGHYLGRRALTLLKKTLKCYHLFLNSAYVVCSTDCNHSYSRDWGSFINYAVTHQFGVVRIDLDSQCEKIDLSIYM